MFHCFTGAPELAGGRDRRHVADRIGRADHRKDIRVRGRLTQQRDGLLGIIRHVFGADFNAVGGAADRESRRIDVVGHELCTVARPPAIGG
jgi:hypothetical protein